MAGASERDLAQLIGSMGLSAAESRADLPAEFEVLYREHFDFVFRSVRRFGVAEAQIDDAVQDAFLVVLRRIGEFRRGSNPRPWLFAIASRVSANYRRSLKRYSGRLSPLEDGPDPAAGPFERAANRDAARVLQVFLDRLSEINRAVFILSELEQMTGPEVAKALDANLNTVYWRVRELRQEFADYLVACGAVDKR